MRREPDNAYKRLAAESVLRWLNKLIDRIDGVASGEDPEDIHRMRVASRRLRTAMALFKDCLPKKKRKLWRKMIRRVTKDLGPARDLDVQIAFIENFRAEHADEELQSGLESLLDELRARRAELQPSVLSSMNELRAHPALSEMARVVEDLQQQAGEPDGQACTEDTGRRAGAKIMRRLRELLEHEPWVLEPHAAENHHDMRIAAKRLRYAMELLNAVWGDRLDQPVRVVKGFQRVLGTVHDCDVWLELGPEFLRDHPRADELRPGVQCLLDDRSTVRRKLFGEFVDTWRRCQAERFWEDLYRLIHSRPLAAEPREVEA
jgi:CHAD domain-containing protein